MKKLTLFIVLAFFIQFTATSQSCLPEGVHFKYQSEIDNFQTNYPDCTEIEGDVTIGYAYGPPTNLNGLSVLTSIGGNLLIVYTGLTSLTGLDSLTSIGGSLSIGDPEYGGNPNLTSLTGLDNLTTIGGDIFIGSNNGGYDNPLLTNLTGLEGLTSIDGDLTIESNEALTSLTGLDNVISIGGDLWVENNDALTNFTGMENLSSIGGGLLIYANNSLYSFTGLEGLTTLEGNLEIGRANYNGGNSQLTSLEGLDNISGNSITDLYITYNVSLSSCEAQWLCDYLSNPNGSVNIYKNAAGCNNPPEVADACGITLPCLPFGNYYFFTQSQIDNFATNYPNCTIIEGDVEIGRWSGSDITNLNGLNVLTSIIGNLKITCNDALTTLTGLDNVTSIGGNFRIYPAWYGIESSALTSMTGLEGLISIGGDLHIGGLSGGKLPLLTSLTGLDNVTSIGGDLMIEKCDALTSMTGLDNLTSIGGDLGIGPTAYGYQGLADGGSRNAALTSLTGLDNLTSIGGGLRINDNDALISLTGLDNLTSIGGDISLFFNDTLTSLTAIENITSIVGDLSIFGNYALTSLTGLDNVTSIGGDLLIGVDHHYGGLGSNLNSLTGLQNVISIGGDLVVGGSVALTNLTGLGNLTSIEGNLSIGYYFSDSQGSYYIGNPALINLTGLDNLTSIGEDLMIYANDTLTSLMGLENIGANSITDIEITNNVSLSNCEGQWLCDYLSDPNGSVTIHNNATGCNNPPEIADACGITLPCLPFGIYYFSTQSQIDNFATNYPGCADLAGNVTILGLDIINLNGLSVVTSIGGSLTIGNYDYGNPTLTSLTGLDNLTSIGGGLSIYNNDALTSLTSLDNMTSIGGDLSINDNDALTSLIGLDNIDSIPFLYIRNNHSLSTCEVKSVCDYLASYNGYIYIGPNAPGCNSQEEVKEACDPVFVLDVLSNKLLIFPNPSSTQITIELPNKPQKNALLTIYNMNGQQMLTSKIAAQKTVVNISGLPNGIYFIKVADDSVLSVGKLVKN